MFPALTLGNGPCVGVLVASGNSFDGPLYEYSNRPGATHGVELRISQGISPLGEWAPTLLACDVTAIIDWHNHDTGQSGTVHQHIPARNNSTSPVTTVFETGRGNVSLTVRTDHPNLPASANVFVP